MIERLSSWLSRELFPKGHLILGSQTRSLCRQRPCLRIIAIRPARVFSLNYYRLVRLINCMSCFLMSSGEYRLYSSHLSLKLLFEVSFSLLFHLWFIDLLSLFIDFLLLKLACLGCTPSLLYGLLLILINGWIVIIRWVYGDSMRLIYHVWRYRGYMRHGSVV